MVNSYLRLSLKTHVINRSDKDISGYHKNCKTHMGQAHHCPHKPHEKHRHSVIAQMARFQDPLRKPRDEEQSKYITLEDL